MNEFDEHARSPRSTKPKQMSKKKTKTSTAGKWKITKTTLEETDPQHLKKPLTDFPQSTYLHRQQLQIDEAGVVMESKDQIMQRIYYSNYEPAVLVQVQPNLQYAPQGRPRKRYPGTMPKAKGRFQYTCYAYGEPVTDFVETSRKPKNKRSKTKSDSKDTEENQDKENNDDLGRESELKDDTEKPHDTQNDAATEANQEQSDTSGEQEEVEPTQADQAQNNEHTEQRPHSNERQDSEVVSPPNNAKDDTETGSNTTGEADDPKPASNEKSANLHNKDDFYS